MTPWQTTLRGPCLFLKTQRHLAGSSMLAIIHNSLKHKHVQTPSHYFVAWICLGCLLIKLIKLCLSTMPILKLTECAICTAFQNWMCMTPLYLLRCSPKCRFQGGSKVLYFWQIPRSCHDCYVRPFGSGIQRHIRKYKSSYPI